VQETVTPRSAPRKAPAGTAYWALLWLGSTEEPGRDGEALLVPPGRTSLVGRLPAAPGNHHLEWVQQRPDQQRGTGPFRSPQVSRAQLELLPTAAGLQVKNLGRLPLLLAGRPVEQHLAVEGTVLRLGDTHALLVTRRLPVFDGGAPTFAFGDADPWGLVGEAPVMWELRRHVAFVGARRDHVLVCGPSGSGKEAVARALHAASPRARGPWVARSAATLPESLLEAELFGHVAHFPQHGMAARPGLVGQADGGTLFLDEIGEMPESAQARLLRLLDDGEYHRLGESQPRRADVRIIGATNRAPHELKHDLLARLSLRVTVPGLNERLEDLPLLARHLLQHARDTDPTAFAHLALGGATAPCLHPELLARLATHRFSTHVRELRRIVWTAVRDGTGAVLNEAEIEEPEPQSEALSAELIQAALDRHGGAQEPAWRELGLPSRHALARLVKRHGLRVRGRA
jgi:two-component system response regulator HydG